MAEIRTQPVVEDLGSEQVKKLTDSYNALVELVGNILDDLEGAANIGAVNAAATVRLAEIESDIATVVAVGRQPGVPEGPSRPVTS
jgi:hypothetical protein